MPTPDTRSARLLLTTEARLEAAVITVMSEWVQATREAILHEAAQSFGLTAAGYPDPTRSVDAAAAAYRVWRQGVNNTLIPQVGIAFGEAYNQSRHSADFSPYRFEQEYLATVSDRLVIWPEGAFEDIRPEIMEALSEGEDFDQIRDRVGRVLGIGARTRAIQARINEIDIELTDPMLDAASERALRAARAELWREHDDSLGEWQWKARRIARTEAQGAVNGGKLSAARAAEIATGQHYHKRWRSTPDRRVRLSHHVADGQVVALSDRFRVGGFLLDHPGDPSGIAPHETINCLTDPDTPITTDRGPKRVADIQIGDRVLTHQGRFRPVVRLAAPRQHSGDVVCLEIGGSVLRLTKNHPVLTDQGWVIAGELSRGRIVLCSSPIELGHRVVQPNLLGKHRSSARTASAADAHWPVRDELGMTLLDHEVGDQRRAQLSCLGIRDLPAEHLGPAVLERLPVRVDNSDTGDLVEEPDDSLVAVDAEDERLVVELASRVRVLSLASGTCPADRDGPLAVDESGDVGGGDGVKSHWTIVPRTVARYWTESALEVPLFNFAVDEDESYVAAGVVVHNCRCVIAVLTPDLLQRELQGPNGSMGEIRPGGIRMGPDDPDDADHVIAALAKETGRPAPSIGQRGEDHGQTSPAPAPIDIPTPTDRRDPDLTGLSDDELLAVMAQALDDRDMAVFEAVNREFDRRDQNDSTPDDHEEDDDVPRPQEPVHQLPTPPQDTGTFDAFTDPDDDRTIPLDTIGPEPDWTPAPDRQPQRLDADTIQQLIDLGFSAVPTDTDGQVLVNDQPFTLIHTPRIGDIPAPPGGRIIVDVPSGDPRSLLAELLAALGHALIEAVVIVAGRISAWRRPPP